jgi:hypothetical protein
MGTKEIILGLLLFFPAAFAAGLIGIQYASLKTLFWRRAEGASSPAAARGATSARPSMARKGLAH